LGRRPSGKRGERYAGQFQKQLLSTVGIKTDQAPSAEQRMRALAREFNAAKGIVPSAEFYASDFQPFTDALRRGNMSDATDALEELLQKKPAGKIAEHFQRWVAAPYTGQRAREGEFMRSLSAEQRARYEQSRQERRALARKALEVLRDRRVAR
jgi:hypothetical protein